MQKLKIEVKNRILDAALQEFYTVGYKQSSMRNIAKKAKVTPGNIYAYFEGKDGLFEQVLAPTIQHLNSFIFEVSKGEKLTEVSIEELTLAITQVFIANRHQFIILMNKSTGSKYENIRADITALVEQRITEELFPDVVHSDKNRLLARAVATAIIGGVFCIFNTCGEDIARLNNCLEEFLSIFLKDIDKRI